METTDVTEHNRMLHDYLQRESRCGRGGYGCQTQIRLEYLRADGYHIRPQFDGVIDKTYACAIRGFNVPFPTPVDEFTPMCIRRSWDQEWPKLDVRANQNSRNGWH